mmetsp:Transcript_19611/g.32803  ORF Transcript_19611/g.32803 Transcript_19611/m.32803 type:complete len:442 (+) Transcript_19611:31-1356(+)
MAHLISFLLCSLMLMILITQSSAATAVLTDVSLQQQLGQHKTMVVMFYAPWCSHSKETLPIWEEMAELMSKSTTDKDIFLGKIDCVAEPDAYWREGISSFPTIKVYVNHNTIPIVYDGERVANTMWRYFRAMHEQYVTEITTMEEFAALQETKLSATKPLALAVLSPEDSLEATNPANRKIDGACKRADRVHCVITRNPSIATELGLQTASLTLLTMFRDQVIDLPITRKDIADTKVTAMDLSDWMLDLSYPPVLELTPENADLAFTNRRRGYDTHIIFLIPDASTTEGQEFLQTLKMLSMRFLGQCVVLYVDLANRNDYSTEIVTDLRGILTDALTSASSTESAVHVPDATIHSVVSKKSAVHFFVGSDVLLGSSSAGTAKTAESMEDEAGPPQNPLLDVGHLIKTLSSAEQLEVLMPWVEKLLQGKVRPVKTNVFEKPK